MNVASLPGLVSGSERVGPEAAGRLWAIRSFALATIALSGGYLAWRIGFTLDSGALWASIMLVVLEIHNFMGLLLYTHAGWRIDAIPYCRRVEETDLNVAVLVTTYDEPIEVLLPVVAAAVELQPAHQTWVLDDGNRQEISDLAAAFGASYLARATNEDAKAGNLNNALEHVEADIVAVLDADHVPAPDLLHHTLGYFDDPAIGFVQTPQEFYNTDSFEHQATGSNRAFNEEAVFYRVILPAKNRWGAAFWCGTGALLRTEALKSVGGVATETVTEDIHTSVRMHAIGWKSVAHNEVLARGLAAADANQYLLQRNRWSTGAMQVLAVDNPLTRPGLKVGQRLSYAATLFAWFDAWRSLGYVLLPVAVALTGKSPVGAPATTYLPVFATVLVAQFVALRLLARGYYPPFLSVLFETLRMPAVLPATLAITGRSRSFKPTPKGQTDADRDSVKVPTLLVVLATASTVALLVLPFGLLDLLPWRYDVPAAAAASAVFCAVNLILMIVAIRRIRSIRFAGERRNAYRFSVDWTGTYGGRACRIVDVSLTGARLVVDDSAPAADRTGAGSATNPLVIDTPTRGHLHLRCHPRRLLGQADGTRTLGIDFAPGQLNARRDLSLAVFHDTQARSLSKQRTASADNGTPNAAVGSVRQPTPQI